MPKVLIYTDGSCWPNPEPGGWAALLVMGNNEKMISGQVPETTNNRMELRAMIEALKALKRPCWALITTDSQLTKKCAEGQWQRKSNTDLWALYDEAAKRHETTFYWVRGHDGHPENERVDAEAQRQARLAKTDVKQTA